MKTLHFRNPTNRSSRRCGTRGFLFIPLLLVCFGFSPTVQAVGPDTDGSIPGANNGEGIGVLVNRTGGIWNTGTGFEALNHLTAGNQNTATGLRALFSDTNGGFNTATGVYSLFSNTSGFFNSATGAYSLANNTTGLRNTAHGYAALYFNTEGEENAATGFGALYKNTTGSENTANGDLALNRNTTGNSNMASGGLTLFNNTTGSFNTANGSSALFFNTTGAANTANGYQALLNNTEGVGNTAVGQLALRNNASGDLNTALGIGAGGNVTTASNVICIGHDGANVDDSCFIGNIFGATIDPSAVLVGIDSTGKLGTMASSKRFKEEIQPMDKASEALLSLKPVTFRYKNYKNSPRQFGLIAEEVAEVNPDLVARDDKGEVYTVRYDQINAMLLNEFLKEHKKVEAQQATITELKSTIAQQQKGMEVLATQLNEQAVQIQKVSAQVEMTKPAPTLVLNNP